jgi:hypothetical protein
MIELQKQIHLDGLRAIAEVRFTILLAERAYQQNQLSFCYTTEELSVSVLCRRSWDSAACAAR